MAADRWLRSPWSFIDKTNHSTLSPYSDKIILSLAFSFFIHLRPFLRRISYHQGSFFVPHFPPNKQSEILKPLANLNFFLDNFVKGVEDGGLLSPFLESLIRKSRISLCNIFFSPEDDLPWICAWLHQCFPLRLRRLAPVEVERYQQKYQIP